MPQQHSHCSVQQPNQRAASSPERQLLQSHTENHSHTQRGQHPLWASTRGTAEEEVGQEEECAASGAAVLMMGARLEIQMVPAAGRSPSLPKSGTSPHFQLLCPFSYTHCKLKLLCYVEIFEIKK